MNRNGFSLIEVLLALTIVGGALLVISDAILYVNSGALELAPTAQLRLHGQECLEAVRWIRDAKGYDALTDGTWALAWQDGQWTLVDPVSADDDMFVQRAAISEFETDAKRIDCSVTWTGTASHSFTLMTILARR